jgi:glycosyltransferase involved in cell wall biosynthesis
LASVARVFLRARAGGREGRLKVLFLDQFSELGGGQHALLDTVDAVKQMGWDAHVLLPGHGPLVEALQSRQVQVDAIPCGPYRSGPKSAGDSLRFIFDLPRQAQTIGSLVADANISLIYANGPRLFPAVALASRGRTPVVFHVHSHLSGFALRLARWAVRRTGAKVVGCSKSVLRPLECAGHVIPNGVRDIGYRERELTGSVRIGIVGRISPEKGQLELVNAAEMLRARFPRARFVICGAPMFGAPSSYFEAVRLLARDLPVEFIGWQQDVGRVLNDLDLLVIPSHQEGMARIALEAFSAGLPVIAFPAGGIPEAVIDGETGFLTRQFSAEALAARIRDVLEADPDNVRQVVRNARQAWLQSYTTDTYQERITKLLQPLASDSQQALRPERAIEMPLQPR